MDRDVPRETTRVNGTTSLESRFSNVGLINLPPLTSAALVIATCIGVIAMPCP